MQQTEKYQFHLIESSDAFSAVPLNANMEKVESALSSHEESTQNPHQVTAVQIGAAKAIDRAALIDGLPPAGTNISTEGWYRFARNLSSTNPNCSVLCRIYHAYYSGGPGDILFYAALNRLNPSIVILNNAISKTNYYQKFRIVRDSTYTYLDIYYGLNSPNSLIPTFVHFGTSASPIQPLAFEAVSEELAEGETLILEQTINSTPSGNVLTDANGAQSAVGSYSGSGTYGADSPRTLTFSFVPKFVAVSPNNTSTTGGAFFISGQTTSSSVGNTSTGSSGNDLTLSWTGQTVTWYSNTSAEKQFNTSGTTYYWFAIS